MQKIQIQNIHIIGHSNLIKHKKAFHKYEVLFLYKKIERKIKSINNNKLQQSIISIILCFFMVFSNIVSTFAYEWGLVVTPIVNNESDVIINSSNDLNDNQVIINGNNDISILTNNSNNINTITNNNITKDTIEQNILTENGRIVKTKIEPVYKNLTRANKQTFTLVGRDKGADATVSFKGDEVGATNHQLIDYITRHNGDNNCWILYIPFLCRSKRKWNNYC